MNEYDEEILHYFLEHQTQLFPEAVAESPEEAEEFLEDCMAVVCKNIKEVRDYFDDAGMDVAGMSEEELLEASEFCNSRWSLSCRRRIKRYEKKEMETGGDFSYGSAYGTVTRRL